LSRHRFFNSVAGLFVRLVIYRFVQTFGGKRHFNQKTFGGKRQKREKHLVENDIFPQNDAYDNAKFIIFVADKLRNLAYKYG